MKRYLIVFGLLGALVAVADTAADEVMFKKKQESKPARSFLEDVVPVKETKADVPKPTVETPEPVAEAPKPAVKTTEPVTEKPKLASEPPKPAVEAPAPVSETSKPDVTVEKKAADVKPDTKAKKEKKPKPPTRDAIITADRTDYDRKEGVVLFDRNVYVDDEQYQMHADRLFLFLDGTNDLKRLVAIGHVAITNEDKRAYCARATFNKKLGRVVMYSSDEITAQLHEEGKKGSDVKGEKITFWLNSEQVEVENPVITMPGGFGGQESMKKLIGK